MFKLKNREFNGYTIKSFDVNRYVFGESLAIMMYCVGEYGTEPYAPLTVNIDSDASCSNNCSYIDVNNLGMEILDFIEENNIAKPTGITKESGYCKYPEYEFNKDFLDRYMYKNN